MNIDVTSRMDIESKLSPNQARKILTEILNRAGTSKITFSRHCRDEMKKDSLTTVDVFNVLKAGLIYEEPEWTRGTYRYRVETDRIIVVIAFSQSHYVRCITAWRK